MLVLVFLGVLSLAVVTPGVAQRLPDDHLWLTDRLHNTRIDRFGRFGPGVQALDVGLLRRSLTGGTWWIGGRYGGMGRFGIDGRLEAYLFWVPAPIDIVTDRLGNAWVAHEDGKIELLDEPLRTLETFAVAGAPRALAIDETGRVWVGVENRPAAMLSWRDHELPRVFTVTLPGSIGQIVDVVVDGRPAGSHVFVIGDGSHELVELDRAGRVVAVRAVGADPQERFHQLAVGADGHIWLAGPGGLWSADPRSGAVSHVVRRRVEFVTFDAKGGLWVGKPFGFGIERVDPVTGLVDVDVGFPIRIGDDAAGLSLALVVDPGGDADGDGDANAAEVRARTNPWDPASSSSLDVSASRVTIAPGTRVDVDARGALGFGYMVFGVRSTAPVRVPGVSGELWLDPVLPVTVPMPVPGRASLVVPSAIRSGARLSFQVVHGAFGRADPAFSEVVGLNAQ